MPTPAKVTFDEIRETCEAFYARDGFVCWADVAKVHGVSRQAIQLRLKKELQRGELDQATFDRWASMTVRAATQREITTTKLGQKREKEKQIIRCLLTPENVKWLRMECIRRNVRSNDIINGLINKAREEAR